MLGFRSPAQDDYLELIPEFAKRFTLGFTRVACFAGSKKIADCQATAQDTKLKRFGHASRR